MERISRSIMIFIVLVGMMYELQAQQNEDKNHSLSLIKGQGVQSHHNKPYYLTYCFEGCEILNQKQGDFSQWMIQYGYRLSKHHNVLLSFGRSTYQFTETRVSTYFQESPFETDYKLLYNNLGIHYRFVLPLSDNLSIQTSHGALLEFLQKGILDLEENAWTYRADLGVQYFLNQSIGITASAFYQTAVSAYQDDNLPQTGPFKPFGYGGAIGVSYCF